MANEHMLMKFPETTSLLERIVNTRKQTQEHLLGTIDGPECIERARGLPLLSGHHFHSCIFLTSSCASLEITQVTACVSLLI